MRGDRVLSYAILLQPFLAILQLLLPMFGISTIEESADLRVYAVMITMIPAIIVSCKCNTLSVVLPFILYLIIVVIHYSIFPLSHAFLESRKAITLTPIVILTGIFMYNLRSIEPFKKAFLWISRLSVPLAALFVWGHLNSPFIMDESNYNMSFGYTLLFPTLFLFTQNNAFDKAASLLMWVLIIFGGSRGPAVVAAVFYVISLLFYTRKGLKIWQVAIFLGLTIAGATVLPNVLDFSSSRTVMLFEEGEGISHDSDRSLLYVKALANISESPIIGNGIGSDWAIMGGYCHNFFLEISLHYGLLFAVIICLTMALSAFMTYRKSRYLRNSEDKQLFVLILIGGLMPLMVSSSYLLSANFGMVIGMLLRYRYSKRIIVS